MKDRVNRHRRDREYPRGHYQQSQRTTAHQHEWSRNTADQVQQVDEHAPFAPSSPIYVPSNNEGEVSITALPTSMSSTKDAETNNPESRDQWTAVDDTVNEDGAHKEDVNADGEKPAWNPMPTYQPESANMAHADL